MEGSGLGHFVSDVKKVSQQAENGRGILGLRYR